MDTYKTIIQDSPEVIYKVKNSKFYGYVFPLEQAKDTKNIIDNLKKKTS